MARYLGYNSPGALFSLLQDQIRPKAPQTFSCLTQLIDLLFDARKTGSENFDRPEAAWKTEGLLQFMQSRV